MFKFTLNLLAVILFCFGLISCGGGNGGGGSGGNPTPMNGGGLDPLDRQGPADPVIWDIELIGTQYTNGQGQARLEWQRGENRFVYHMMLEDIENRENVQNEDNFPTNPYDDTDGFQIRTAVQDIQNYNLNDNQTKRYEGDVESGFGGYYQYDHESTDLGSFKFIYASNESGLGITQLQNGDLFTVGSAFSGSPTGTFVYSGINIIGRYDESKNLDVGLFIYAS